MSTSRVGLDGGGTLLDRRRSFRRRIRRSAMRKMLAVLFLITASVSNAFAWGEEGHRMVCRIAWLSLSPDDQKEVDRLTKAYKTPPNTRLQISSFPDTCVFAD